MAKRELPEPLILNSQTAIAGLFGVQPSAIGQWQKIGMPYTKTSSGNQYNATECVQWYLGFKMKHVQSQKEGEQIEYMAEKARLTKEQADRAELQNQISRGESIPAKAISMVIAKVGATMSAKLSTIPGAIKRTNPHIDQQGIKAMRTEIANVQNMMADDLINFDLDDVIDRAEAIS